MKNYDLHCHSTASDGLLAPADLVSLAAQRGVDVLALTDHDDTAGLDEAAIAAASNGIEFVPGVEISVTWENHSLHIVGLRIDPANPALCEGLASIRSGRLARARRMADDLAGVGIGGTFEDAIAHAGNPNMIGRTHFARCLVERGLARDVKGVFRRYLVRGKPGYTPHAWPTLESAIGWINGSGGQAVIAHPGRYDLGPNVLARLLGQFRDCGGSGIEVVTSNHTGDQIRMFAERARQYGLMASRGSDYHGPGETYVEPGRIPPLPESCVPIWRDWPVLVPSA